MYLKNNSNYCVTLKTKSKLYGFQPGDFKYIPDFDIINIHSKLTVISEETYKKLNKEKEKEEKKIEKVESNEQVNDEQKENVSTAENKLIDTPNVQIEEKDNTVNEVKQSKPRGRKKLTNEEIEQKIESLKQEFTDASTSKERETLAKQIKGLQEKLK